MVGKTAGATLQKAVLEGVALLLQSLTEASAAVHWQRAGGHKGRGRGARRVAVRGGSRGERVLKRRRTRVRAFVLLHSVSWKREGMALSGRTIQFSREDVGGLVRRVLVLS